jgi:phosphosulfolactate synthase (CoM biosynthesis protein A)
VCKNVPHRPGYPGVWGIGFVVSVDIKAGAPARPVSSCVTGGGSEIEFLKWGRGSINCTARQEAEKRDNRSSKELHLERRYD